MAHIFVSAVVPAPVAAVWSVIRDFNSLPQWHPGIAASRIEDDLAGALVGSVRRFELAAGGTIRERLLALDDREHRCTYTILESPLPVSEYVATLQLQPITLTDHTFATWAADFRVEPALEAETVATIGQGVFAAGFAALQRRFASYLA